ncbi:MAG: hypothetical protein L0Z62_45605 [Gemmataceae bacterium]|nr:hypothetical protein [Gemmataceae bacterium]
MFPGVRIKPPLLADYVALTDIDVHGADHPERPAIGLVLTVAGRTAHFALSVADAEELKRHLTELLPDAQRRHAAQRNVN